MNKLINTLKTKLDISDDAFSVTNDNFYKRLESGDPLSLIIGEAYMAGEWTGDLPDFFRKVMVVDNYGDLLRNSLRESPIKSSKLIVSAIWNEFKTQVTDTVRNNQSRTLLTRTCEHYAIPEIMYKYMLDEHLQYTSGYWKSDTTTLDEAQHNKLNCLIEKLNIPLDKECSVLDIGCGFGCLANLIAKRYPLCNVVGCSISREHINFSNETYGSKNSRLEYHLCDYRDIDSLGKKFDRIVSVEMTEHVGIRNLSSFYDICASVLTDDGLMVIQVMNSLNQSKYINGCDKYTTDPFIDKYIFPASYLATVPQFSSHMNGKFIVREVKGFTGSYEKTLRCWHDNLLTNWTTIQASDTSFFTQSVFNMMEFYLQSCAVLFELDKLQVNYFVLEKSVI